MNACRLKTASMGLIILHGVCQATTTPVDGKTLINQQKSKSLAIRKSWYASLSIGSVFSPHDTTMVVKNLSNAPFPYNQDQYSTKLQKQALLSLNVGKRWARDQSWFPIFAIGMQYQHIFKNDIKGSVTQYSDPVYKNYAYAWSTKANIVSANTKVNIAHFGSIMPYIAGGVGASINQAGPYSESPYTNITPRINPNFSTRSHTQFYYDVGLGFDVLLAPQWMTSIGYDYQSFGAMGSGGGQTTWSGTHLSLGRFNSHTALVGLTYLY